MNDNILRVNVANFVTITIMAALGLALYTAIGKAVKAKANSQMAAA